MVQRGRVIKGGITPWFSRASLRASLPIMGLADTLRGWLGGGPSIRVHILVRGRIGDGWVDIDEALRLPEGSTVRDLVAAAERRGIPLAAAIEKSPHLAHTLMLNGERCPVVEHAYRRLTDGDEVFVLSPLAGG
jgi:sulfur carrier protein ThiS